MYFDGSGDYIQAVPSLDFTSLGYVDFTTEMWVYCKSYNSQSDTRLWINGSNINFELRNTGEIWLYPGAGTSTNAAKSGSNNLLPLNRWVHIVGQKNGSNAEIFFNGIRVAQTSVTWSTDTVGRSLSIGFGPYSGGSYEGYFNGYISDFRFVKGTALYTSNFTPPTAPLQPITNTKLLLSGNNGGVEDSLGKRTFETDGNAQIDTTVKKFGSGAIEFDGNGDYLKGTGFDLSGKYTIEGWFYRRAQSGYQKIFGQCGSTWDWSSTGVHVSFYFDQITNYLRYEIPYGQNVSPYVYAIATTSAPAADTWHYFAAICDGTNTSLFLNGIRVGTTPNIIPWTNGLETECSIGGNGGMSASGTPSAHFNGFLDDFRVTVGVARYDPTQTSHTVPTKTHPTI